MASSKGSFPPLLPVLGGEREGGGPALWLGVPPVSSAAGLGSCRKGRETFYLFFFFVETLL